MDKNQKTMKMYLLYAGDSWLSNSSIYLVAVCTSHEKAKELAITHSNSGREPMTDDDLNDIECYNQTYGRNENYMISPTETDTLDI